MDAAFVDCETHELLVWQHIAKHYRIQKPASRSARLGLSKSHQKGRGIEFHNARIYQPGDDAKVIDWRITARKNKAHTREFQEDRDHQTLILVDMGSAMRFGSHNILKSVQAAHLSALCGWMVLANQDRIGGIVLSEPLSIVKPSSRRSYFSAWLDQLSAATKRLLHNQEAKPADWSVGIQSALNLVNDPSTLILVGDLVQLDEGHRAQLGILAKRHDVIALHVYDDLECDLPPTGQAKFSHSGKSELVDLLPINQIYHQQYANALDSLKTFFCSHGMKFQALEARESPLLRLQQLGVISK